MRLSAIVCMDKAGGIGKGGKMPWPKLTADLARFREHTMGKPVIMGRVTWESIGKPLPGRHIVVVSHSLDHSVAQAGVQIARDIPQALDMASCWGPEAVVAGGATIYQPLLFRCSELLVTVLDESFDCDVFFPWYGTWKVDEPTRLPAEQSPIGMWFYRLTRPS